MTAYVKISGTWRPAAIYIKRGGSWHGVSTTSVRVGGTFRTVTSPPSPPPPLPPSPPSPPPPPVPPGAVSGYVSPSSLSNTISGAGTASTGNATINASGGTPPYTYNWMKISGTALSVSNPGGSATSFSFALSAGQSVAATYRGTVTDQYSTSAYGDVNITLTATVPPLSASASPTSVTGSGRPPGRFGTNALITSAATNVSAAGGSGSYNYSWALIGQSSDSGTSYPIAITSPSSSSTTFNGTINANDNVYATARCTISDTSGNSTTVDVSVTLICGPAS